MARFVNDWATEAIVRQWMKNKRSYAVRQGFIEVKPKWEYLKDNAAKRTDAPRGNGKRKATSQLASSQAAKKARLMKTSAKTKGMAKAKALMDDDEDDDEDDAAADNDMESGKADGGSEEDD